MKRKKIYICIQVIIFATIVRLFAFVVMGLTISEKDKNRLPTTKKAFVIASTHDSTFDTFVIMLLVKLHMIKNLRPVAAIENFFEHKGMRWWAKNIMGAIPIERRRSKRDRKSTRLNSSHTDISRMPSSA